MRVLVTGNRGYIGSVLVPRLLERGHEVTGLDSDLFARCSFREDPVDVPTIIEDVRDVRPDMLAGHDAIIHLAGLSNDPLGDYNEGLTEAINAAASVRLAEMAKEVGVSRFIFASSCSSYGMASEDFVDESGECNPVTAYGRSKIDTELALHRLADENFTPTYLRASTAYGLSPRIRFDLVVNNLTAWAVATGEVHLKSDGTPWRPLVHVEDIALAYIAALEADRHDVHDRAFNVGQTSENFRVSDIARIVADIGPGARLSFADGAGPDMRNYRVDCGMIARSLHGFKPQWTCRRGVEQLYDAFCAEGVTVEAFEGAKFSRIAHLKQLVAEGEIGTDLRRKLAVAA
jgi:nucleoside-diphosphate-sugar epimerase